MKRLLPSPAQAQYLAALVTIAAALLVTMAWLARGRRNVS